MPRKAHSYKCKHCDVTYTHTQLPEIQKRLIAHLKKEHGIVIIEG